MTQPDRTLLVVDDEPEILDTLRRTLRREGYRILVATSGQEALRLCEQESVDILMSDIDMPGMSGVELVRQVRLEHPRIVRMLLTGAASLESALQAINEGEIHRYLTKPWERDDLRKTLREAFARLDELGRSSAAGRRLDRRKRLLAELDREHPGIVDVKRDEGVYIIDEGRLTRALLRRRVRSARQTQPDRTLAEDDSGGEA